MGERQLCAEQPDSFAFTDENQAWAENCIHCYPEGCHVSAIVPLLTRAQDQEGWLTKPAIEYVCRMLSMPFIRGLEVATFYTMFYLSPVGRLAHIQVCGTTPCMLSCSDNLIAVCKKKIAPYPFELSPDGKFSWEEVECLGACANAPVVRIGVDYYEDVAALELENILDTIASSNGNIRPKPGSLKGRFSSEAEGAKSRLMAVSLSSTESPEVNATVELALREKGNN